MKYLQYKKISKLNNCCNMPDHGWFSCLLIDLRPTNRACLVLSQPRVDALLMEEMRTKLQLHHQLALLQLAQTHNTIVFLLFSFFLVHICFKGTNTRITNQVCVRRFAWFRRNQSSCNHALCEDWQGIGVSWPMPLTILILTSCNRDKKSHHR